MNSLRSEVFHLLKRRRPAALPVALKMAPVFFLMAGAVFCAQDKPAAAAGPEKKDAPAAAAPAPTGPATYVGSETCAGCHEDISKAFQKNPHHIVEEQKKRGFDGKACESCHGPGSKHAESMDKADIRNPSKLSPGATDKICLTCHLNQPTHAGRIESSHAKNAVSCTSCHAIHKNGPHGLVARKPNDINRQCGSCHTAALAQFNRPFHHKLPEGAMSCVDCHNPHGSTIPRQVQTVSANEPGCLKCHGDKRGPFAFEHAPMKVEGCIACHEPHGSANPRMLNRHEVRFTCLQCHMNLPVAPQTGVATAVGVVPPAFHDLRSPRFRNCTICHQKVHGSQVDRTLFR